MTKTYMISEIFFSLQGEGVRAGTANVFIRFSGCNMRCSKTEASDKSPGNFDCDTEFESGRKMTAQDISLFIKEIAPDAVWLILTGGEPALQVDQEFIWHFHQLGFLLAIETNGSIELPRANPEAAAKAKDIDETNRLMSSLDWITVSPKVAEHCIRQKYAHEVKYVRGYGQAIPKTVVQAEHYVISPAFEGNELDRKTLEWCIKLVKDNPKWRLSVQQHKSLFGGVR